MDSYPRKEQRSYIAPPSRMEKTGRTISRLTLSLRLDGATTWSEMFMRGLHCQQVSHPQQPTVDCGGVFDFKSVGNGATLKPYHVNIFYRTDRSDIVVQRKRCYQLVLHAVRQRFQGRPKAQKAKRPDRQRCPGRSSTAWCSVEARCNSRDRTHRADATPALSRGERILARL